MKTCIADTILWQYWGRLFFCLWLTWLPIGIALYETVVKNIGLFVFACFGLIPWSWILVVQLHKGCCRLIDCYDRTRQWAEANRTPAAPTHVVVPVHTPPPIQPLSYVSHAYTPPFVHPRPTYYVPSQVS